MDNELYKAAVRGELSILENASNSDLCFSRRTCQTENNIIHIAVRHERFDFIREALRIFPHLLCENNSHENTPFHVAAETGNPRILELLFASFTQQVLEANADSKPWRMQNSEGNTPLHVALIYGKLQCATMLIGMDGEVACLVNDCRETPLHLAIKHRVDHDRDSALAAMKPLANTPGGFLKVRCPPKEDSLPIIRLLLQENSSAACLHDSNGLSPLLIAVTLKGPYISAVKVILNYCPQSVEVSDSSGKTILHLLREPSWCEDLEYLLSIPEIHALKNSQDVEGNTPAHLAVENHDILTVQLLCRLSANFSLKNKKGISVMDMIQQQPDHLRSLLIAKKDCRLISSTYLVVEEAMLDNLLDMLHRKGITHLDSRYVSLLNSDQEMGSVLHRLVKLLPHILQDSEVMRFIKQALDDCPFLICETDAYSDTILHLIARNKPALIDNSLLQMFHDWFQKVEEEAGSEGLYLPPWRLKNKNGNTPLHEALLTGSAKFSFLMKFIEFDKELGHYQNNIMETPFHLLSKVLCEPVDTDVNANVIFRCAYVADIYDNDGLTPLMRAAQDHNLELVSRLYMNNRSSAKIPRKCDGQIFWHLLANKKNTVFAKTNQYLTDFLFSATHYASFEFLSDYHHLLFKCDNDGNTPLHLAIEKGNFGLAQFFIDQGRSKILTVHNKKGLTPADLIGSAEHIPRQFDNFLWSKPQLVKHLLGVRSLSGVPSTLIKEYTNTLGVIAALLTTITFSAAFQVPGGLDSSNGSPLLLRKTAFQVFIVSDMIAMCLSMMVLFCLLWIMTMSNKRQSVVLLDLSIFLLQISFYATIVTFMMGLYATAFHNVSWVAILACTFCSSLILLMHKGVMYLIVPTFMKLFIASRRAVSLLPAISAVVTGDPSGLLAGIIIGLLLDD